MDSELKQQISSLDEGQKSCLSAIVSRIKEMKADSWTGKTTFELNVTQGTIADMGFNRTEKISFTRRRRVKSKGIK